MLTIAQFQDYFNRHKPGFLKDYFTYLSFPSIATDPAYKNDVKDCAKWLADYLKGMGLQTETWQTKGAPILFAQDLRAGPEKETILLYCHYDVQPVDPLELWTTPPFTPTVRNGDVFARGAVDNKGQCFYTICALRALLEHYKTLPFNLKFLIEGEEESGSHSLSAILPEKKQALKADHLLIIDSGIQEAGQPAISLGGRGLVCMTITLKGSDFDLHSGVHGGMVYNPNRALVELLASMHTPDGKVSIPGFYDAVVTLSPEEKSLYNLKFDEAVLKKQFGAAAIGMEKGCTPLEATNLRPTVEINGIRGGYSGAGFKTVIPGQAQAKLSCRLVPDQHPDTIGALVENYIRAHVPKGIECSIEIHPGKGEPFRTSPHSKIAKIAAKAYSDVFKKPCDYILSGGSIPIAAELQRTSEANMLLLGVGLSDDKIHAPDEHFGLDRFEQGYLIITQMLGEPWL